jgi:Uma2 family endonuclease
MDLYKHLVLYHSDGKIHLWYNICDGISTMPSSESRFVAHILEELTMTITRLRPAPVRISGKESIFYPESDGEPMANNTRQFHEIVTIEGNLEILFVDDPDVFVIGDLLWYPVEGRNDVRQAPDVMVIFGRPKGHRGSYLQWREDNIAPQVVFEILSPGNRRQEMLDKFEFYERYGVEEYYVYDPDHGRLTGWLRTAAGVLASIAEMNGWVSPRLNVRFEMEGNDLQLHYPDGGRFLTIIELNELRRSAEMRADVGNGSRRCGYGESLRRVGSSRARGAARSARGAARSARGAAR